MKTILLWVFRMPLAVLSWIAYELLSEGLALLGAPIIALAIGLGAVQQRRSKIFPSRAILTWRWAWMNPVWGNDEDGVDGLRGGEGGQEWWVSKTEEWSPFKRMFVWSAIRNPVGNLRFVQPLCPRLDWKRVDYWIGRWCDVSWQGPYTHLGITRPTWSLSIGWKIYPHDAYAPPAPDNWRQFGTGFGLRLQRSQE